MSTEESNELFYRNRELISSLLRLGDLKLVELKVRNPNIEQGEISPMVEFYRAKNHSKLGQTSLGDLMNMAMEGYWGWNDSGGVNFGE